MIRKHFISIVAAILAAFVGAVIGGFTAFFALLAIRQSGLVAMQEFAIWPDYLLITFGFLVGASYAAVLVWRSLERDWTGPG